MQGHACQAAGSAGALGTAQIVADERCFGSGFNPPDCRNAYF
jgi:hypothetical protein